MALLWCRNLQVILSPDRNKFSLIPFCSRSFSKFTDLPFPLRRCRKISTVVMEAPPLGYRPNVGICLINRDNKIFTASRLDIPGAWQMPQGGINEGEEPRLAAMRELKEETGITSAEVIAEAPYWLTYDFPPEVRELLKIQWGSDWKGQAQKWFLFRFTGKEEEIDLDCDETEKPEFSEWTWMPPQQVIELAVDFKKPVYEDVLKYFAPHLQSDSASKV